MTRREIRRLDKAFSLLIRSRGKCEWHPATTCAGPLQCAHIFSRRYLHLRFHPDNALALCAKHHWFGTLNPIEFSEMVKRLYGDAKFLALRQEKEAIRKITVEEVVGWWTHKKNPRGQVVHPRGDTPLDVVSASRTPTPSQLSAASPGRPSSS
jgi:hypothetical protein